MEAYSHSRSSSRQQSVDQRPPTPPSPSHVQAIHDFDPSLLASTSTSSANIYLSFKAGEVIRVHVRDGSGWWDGEILSRTEVDGLRRGWFPSNYVKEIGLETSRTHSSTSTKSSPSSRHGSVSTNHTRLASAASIKSNQSQRSPRSASDQAMSLPESLQTLLHPVVQALSLLESAIHTKRRTHIQPSTACVISAIRSALQQSDCLSKESITLAKWPVLAKERKIVLVELSKLVGCARTASAVEDDEDEESRQLEALARAARAVFASVKRFLNLAGDCGVQPIPLDPALGSAPMEASSSAPGRGRRTHSTSGSLRSQDGLRLKAISVGDLRAARQQASPPPPVPHSAATLTRPRSPSIAASTPISATFSSSGQSSTGSTRSRRPHGSIDSTSSASHSSSSASIREERTPIPPSMPAFESNSSDIHEAIGIAEDGLLSIIAAFIGHIHSHHIGSHPSSHANLIEMTRETIDAVREVLTIVEAVGRHPGVRAGRPREIEHLRMAKDKLYEVASRLVEGAEAVANAPFSEQGEEMYDRVKARLLQTATGTLRAGTECVRVVRVCVPEGESLSANVTPRPDGAGRAIRTQVPDAGLVMRDKVVGERGIHTLSALHRKADSLSHLKQKYQQDGPMAQIPSEEDENEEIVADTSREEDVTLRPVAPQESPSRPFGLLRTFSEDQLGHRNRSSSLSTPSVFPRIQHRSPSRSADLDKFTSDFKMPIVPRSADQPSSINSSSDGDHPNPVTPNAGDVSTNSPMLSYLAPPLTDSTSSLTLEDATPVKPQRPPVMRATTAPLPNQDVQFWVVAHDYDPREITFNSEGNMIGASLTVLVEKMTPHDVPPDPTFWEIFFYTFRLFTTPMKLLDALKVRYDPRPPAQMMFGDREKAIWIERKVVPVRFRIYNFLKAWLEVHWRSTTDDVVLDPLFRFISETIAQTLPAMAPRLLAVVRRRQSGPRSASSHTGSFDGSLRSAPPTAPPGLPPTPIISKSLNSLLQKNPLSSSVNITEFDTLELARQLTILESKAFCRVVPEDLLQTGKRTIPELKALSTMSNQITGWVADNILNEQDAKKRAGLLKFYIKLADKCLMLNNFSTLFALLAGLNSSTVTRLKKTWDGLPSKYRLVIDRLQGVIEHTKNHAAYRARLRETHGPCLPFLGLILTDITFTSEGNPDSRPSALFPETMLINQDKYAKLGKIAMDFSKYQIPFNFHELETVQMFLKRVLAERGSSSLDALYRKSLMLEPRKGAEKINSAVEKPGWLGGKI